MTGLARLLVWVLMPWVLRTRRRPYCAPVTIDGGALRLALGDQRPLAE